MTRRNEIALLACRTCCPSNYYLSLGYELTFSTRLLPFKSHLLNFSKISVSKPVIELHMYIFASQLPTRYLTRHKINLHDTTDELLRDAMYLSCLFVGTKIERKINSRFIFDGSQKVITVVCILIENVLLIETVCT